MIPTSQSALFIALALLAPLTEPPPADAPAVTALRTLIRQELESKGLPAVSIAVVRDQTIVWAEGFGFADRRRTRPATAETIYRVGSVSKLFTDLAVMQLAEAGKLDIDAPVIQRLPSFQPLSPAAKTITLRHLMAHRSGLVREPPDGSYFDPKPPSLAATVESLNTTELVYEPGERIKYSNAGVAVVGRALEVALKQPFAACVRERVLQPLGMTASDFEPTAKVRAGLAEAVMWSYDGRSFPAPTFELGESPAGCMYASVEDLARFLKMLNAGGQTATGRFIKEETLQEMLKPQFEKEATTSGIGIGFLLGELDGQRRVGHNGAVYGFATELAWLPESKLGVAVVCSKDVANAVMTRIADDALRLFLATAAGRPRPDREQTEPLSAEEVRKFAGHYVSREKALDLEAHGGRLYATPGRGGVRTELRRLGTRLIVDDVTGWGPRIEAEEETLRVRGDLYERVAEPKPIAIPERWRGLIGEYGWDHNILFVFEKEGRLWVLIEWVFLYPLTETSDDVFLFPDFGLYHGEKVKFRRGPDGQATEAEAASVRFARRVVAKP